MKLLTMLILGFALTLSACGKEEQAASTTADDMAATIKLPFPESASEKAASARDAVINHMHLHARQLGKLMAALDNGDLDATQVPAYWLSRHEGVSVFPEEWGPYMKAMRVAAQDVQWSTELDTARAAAGRIAESCQACHADAGFEIDITRTNFD